jgi:hypothetical protein
MYCSEGRPSIAPGDYFIKVKRQLAAELEGGIVESNVLKVSVHN